MRIASLAALVLLTPFLGCTAKDPARELEIIEPETYWVVDSPRGATQYLAPAVRFRLRNRGVEPLRSIQATANFRRIGEEENWGSAWEQVASSRRPLDPGDEAVVVLRSDGRYSAAGTPQAILANPHFKDVRTEIYVRIAASSWTKLAETPIERRIGARAVEALVGP